MYSPRIPSRGGNDRFNFAQLILKRNSSARLPFRTDGYPKRRYISFGRHRLTRAYGQHLIIVFVILTCLILNEKLLYRKRRNSYSFPVAPGSAALFFSQPRSLREDITDQPIPVITAHPPSTLQGRKAVLDTSGVIPARFRSAIIFFGLWSDRTLISQVKHMLRASFFHRGGYPAMIASDIRCSACFSDEIDDRPHSWRVFHKIEKAAVAPP